MPATIDQRRSPRQNCAVPVEGKSGSAFDQLRTVDISSGGIGFVCTQSFPLKKKVAVEVALAPDSEPVIVIGEVRWAERIAQTSLYRIGLKFTKSVADGSRDRLKEYFGK